jgi:hypothetical protein
MNNKNEGFYQRQIDKINEVLLQNNLSSLTKNEEEKVKIQIHNITVKVFDNLLTSKEYEQPKPNKMLMEFVEQLKNIQKGTLVHE